MPSEPVRSDELMYPPVPDSVLPRYTADEFRSLLARAEAEVGANPLALSEVTAHLRSLVK